VIAHAAALVGKRMASHSVPLVTSPASYFSGMRICRRSAKLTAGSGEVQVVELVLHYIPCRT